MNHFKILKTLPRVTISSQALMKVVISVILMIMVFVDKYKCLEQLHAAFSEFSYFLKTLHTVSKHLKLEDWNGSHSKSHIATISASANTTTSVSNDPP